MEMEDHHHHHQHHHGNQYGLGDLRRLISSVGGGERGSPAGLLQTQPFPPPFEQLMMMGSYQHGPFRNDHGVAAVLPTSSLGCGDGGDGGTGRWPRQETLTLLEIRSKLDSKFKEANQKGPLWDEVSRTMSEEHGYQRSGKKCREKFENLYKYYKKTKEGKAGRQDGKHYRFFRQLEALYGEPSNLTNNNGSNNIQVSAQDYSMANNLGFHNLSSVPNTADLNHLEGYNVVKNSDSLSFSNNSSEFESSSSDGNESSGKMKRNRARGGWKARIKEFIDSQMRKIMEKQEAWLEKLMRTLEQKEKERGLREEEWRRLEAARLEHEHDFWAKERAWIEARDSALMEALKSYKTVDQNASSLPQLGLNPSSVDDRDGSEIHENGIVHASNRNELAAHHPYHWPVEGLGYDRSGLMCGEKWERTNRSSSKKRKENLRDDRCGNYGNTFENESNTTSLYNQGGYNNVHCDQMNDGTTSSSPNSNANHGVNHDPSRFPFLMGEGSENLWDNYTLKLNKGG